MRQPATQHYTQTSMIDSVDFFIDRDCICTGMGKDGALLRGDCGSRLHRGLLCSNSSSTERTTLATAYHDFTITTLSYLHSYCFGQTPKARCSPDRLFFLHGVFNRRGMGWLAHSGFGMESEKTPTKSDPAWLLISIFTHRRSERFSFASMFAGTGRESAASRQ